MMPRVAVKALNGEPRSPLVGVSDIAWERFSHALTIDDDRGPNKGKPRRFDACTHAGGLGCFGILPRQLLELGVLKEVFVSKGKAIADPRDKRVVIFLSDPLLQRDVFGVLAKRFSRELALVNPWPSGMTRSGALALFFRLGPHALAKWAAHQQPATIALFRRANGLF